jgi:hypothetical protein
MEQGLAKTRGGKCSWSPNPSRARYTYKSPEVGKVVLNKFDNGHQKGVVLLANGPWFLTLWEDGMMMEVDDITRIAENYRKLRKTGELPTEDEFARGGSGEDGEKATRITRSEAEA